MEYFILVFALVIGITALWMSQNFLKLYFIVGRWHKAQAKVLAKEIIYDKTQSHSRTPYRLKIEYSYRYNDIDYRGTKVDLVELSGGFKYHRKIEGDKRVARIKDEVSIYVSPQDPAQSVMYRDGVILFSFVFIMGLFSIIFGLSQIL